MKRNKLSLAVTSAMGIASIAGALATEQHTLTKVWKRLLLLVRLLKRQKGSRAQVLCCSEC